MDEQSIFAVALDKASTVERDAFLDEVCARDPQLRFGVEALLRAHENPDSFLEAGGVNLPRIIEATTTEVPGTIIGPYKLLEQIGEGGFGVVFMAEQSQPVQRLVALKIIKPGMDSRQIIARFEAERQALAMMDHPNIAKVHDAGTVGQAFQPDEPSPSQAGKPDLHSGRPYFVMELVKGIPITKYCDEHQLSLRERLELFIPVCQAVQHAHQKGIIHRDLKPSNVLVACYDDKPVPKVIDFGVAKATGQKLTEKTIFTHFGQLVGTLEYMSPEQAKFNALDIDTRSDIYSLGVLLYELLTGSTPLEKNRFKETAFDEALRIIREEEPPTPSTRLADSKETLAEVAAQRKCEPAKLPRLVRGDLDWIVMKALDKDRNRRYESASALAADVQRYLQDEPVLACPPSRRYRLGKFLRKHRRGVLTAATLLAAALVLGAGIGWVALDRAAQRAETKRQQADTERAVEAAFKDALRLQQERKYPEALSEIRRAEAALVSGTGTPAMEQRVRARLADLQMVIDLEDLRALRGLEYSGRSFNNAGADKNYAKAFLDYGIDVNNLPVGKAVSLILKRSIASELAAALDDWAYMVRLTIPATSSTIDLSEERRRSRRLLQVARQVDADPGRNKFRDAIENGDVAHLKALVADSRADELSAPTVVILSAFLRGPGEHKQALQLLQQAQRRFPNDFWINFELAYAYAFSQSKPPNWDECLRFQSVAVALRPTSAPAHNNLGFALTNKGQLEEAIAEFHEAIRLRPNLADAHSGLASAYAAKEQWSDAAAAYREAIYLEPEHMDALRGYCAVLVRQGKVADAVDSVSKLIKLKPDVAGSHWMLGWLLWRQDKLDEAMEAYRAAFRLNLEDATAYYEFAALLSSVKKDYEGAIGAYREAIRLKPDFAQAYSKLGNNLSRLGRLDEARGAHQQAIRLDPKSVNSQIVLRKTTFKEGDKTISPQDKQILINQEILNFRKANLGADHRLTLAAMASLADAYYYALRAKDSIALYKQVLEVRSRKSGQLDEGMLADIAALAYVYVRAARPKEAVALLDQMLDPTKLKVSVDASIHAVMNKIVSIYFVAKRPDNAIKPDNGIKFAEEVLQLCKEQWGPGHSMTCGLMADLAEFYRQAKQYDKALAFQEELAKQKWTTENYEILPALRTLALAYRDSHFLQSARRPEAIVFFEALLALQRDKLGPDHADTLATVNDLGQLYSLNGDTAKLIALFEAALPIALAKFGPEHPTAVAAVAFLPERYWAKGQFDKYVSIQEEALKIRKTKLGADHRLTLNMMSSVARAYCNVERYDDSISLYKKVIERRSAKVDQEIAITVEYLLRTDMFGLALAYQTIGRFEEGLEVLKEAYKRAKKGPGEGRGIVVKLAAMYRAAGQFDKSLDHYKVGVEIYERMLGPDHTLTLWAKQGRALTLVFANKPQEAEPILRQAQLLLEKRLGLNAPYGSDVPTYAGRTALGLCLVRLKRFTEAEPFLLKGYEALEKETGVNEATDRRLALAVAVNWIIELYDAWGKKDKADEWRQKKHAIGNRVIRPSNVFTPKELHNIAQGWYSNPHRHQVKEQLIFQKLGSPFRIAC